MKGKWVFNWGSIGQMGDENEGQICVYMVGAGGRKGTLIQVLAHPAGKLEILKISVENPHDPGIVIIHMIHEGTVS